MKNYEIINEQLKIKDGTHLFDYDGEINDDIHKVYIPSSISEIKEHAFDKLRFIEEIIVDENNFVYKSSNGCLLLNDNTLLYLPHNKTIPEITKKIAPYACKTSSGDVLLPKNVVEIAPYAFYGSKIKSLVCNSNLKHIKEHAFENCYNLKVIELNEGIEKIGDFSFAFSKINKIFIPFSTINIGINPFAFCDKLKKIEVDEHNTHYTSHYANTICRIHGLSIISGCKLSTIDDFIEEIGDFAFAGCGIENIKLPSSVKVLKDSCFAENNIITFDTNDVKEIGPCVFRDNEYLEKLKLNNMVKSIGPGFVNRCPKLKEIIIPSTVEVLPSKLFFNFLGNKIVIGNGVKVIETLAFEKCYNLSEIYFDGTDEDLKLAIGNRKICDSKINFLTNNK